jgi:hypothetical protein
MKKLLVLAMVLGLVATANAGLCTLSGATSMTVGSTITIAVLSANTAGQAMNLEIDDTAAGAAAQTGTYTLGDWIYTGGTEGMTKYAAAGGMASITGPSGTGYPGFFWFTGAGAPPSTPTAGEWFSIQYKATSAGNEYISLYNDNSTDPISQLVIHQTSIPEPIIMTLLGLGGLFLRRRSK